MWNLRQLGLRSFEIDTPMEQLGRISEQHRGRYKILTESGEADGVLAGRFAHLADGSDARPTVGDFVQFRGSVAEGLLVIERLIERRSFLKRKDPGSAAAAQLLCANIDTVFIVTPASQPINYARIERLTLMARDGGSLPVLVISKCDTFASTQDLVNEAGRRLRNMPVLACSSVSGEGMDLLFQYIGAGDTAVLVGISGAGKTTLLNRLCGTDFATQNTRDRDDKGRHTTTGRSLLFAPGGGMVIDTPGVREFGLTEASSSAFQETFGEVEKIVLACRYRDCSHSGEPGCAVEEALASGELDSDAWKSYSKLQKEEAFYRRKQSKVEQSNAKRRWKQIHKAVRAGFKNNPKRDK